jgi:3-oxoacyl-[acyl-carrier protein] reductase
MSDASRNRDSIVILGATGGIGSALCKILADRKYDLFLAGRSAERLAELSTRFQSPTYSLASTSSETILQCVRQAKKTLGRVDGIANCIGSLLLKPAHLTSDLEWEETLAVNLGSAFAAVRAAAETMQEGGSVVLVSSAAARVGLPSHEAIAAAKAGIEGLTRSAAASYGSRGLRFNAVAPGLVRTNLTLRLWENSMASAASVAMHALGRLGEPEDVASMIAWLLDRSNNWVTGQVFGVDGGLGSVRGKGRQKE